MGIHRRLASLAIANNNWRAIFNRITQSFPLRFSFYLLSVTLTLEFPPGNHYGVEISWKFLQLMVSARPLTLHRFRNPVLLDECYSVHEITIVEKL